MKCTNLQQLDTIEKLPEERLEVDLDALDNETVNDDLDEQLPTFTYFMLKIIQLLLLYLDIECTSLQ